MEVCVDCIDSAVEAECGGAKRVELCSSLISGGLTPSLGLLLTVKKLIKIPVFVMVRAREGDFNYSRYELDCMLIDAKLLKDNGADGFVFGCLRPDGSIDVECCQELIDVCKPHPLTFHRAIDVSSNPVSNLKILISLGFDRVLTSGGEYTALEGSPVIKEMVQHFGNEIIVVPGGGVSETNLQRILDETDAKEFHASATNLKISSMTYTNQSVSMTSSSYNSHHTSEYARKVCDRNRVKAMVRICNGGL
ncbi:hypothetical protein HELRODRAFT_159889 [Helobdella robusta]|uniref:Copper homeostasis protein cutC homolog n=1 Tax=Helobdella robusta TaxID=6412 RepID=T1EPI2_HELRO|nr:hypothetical protein HELRODRAFT_159889 [Helobdella robusta]ESO05813.1 hypothetical protein HELRODRAFT_159889 [Helobdella robusta]